MLKIHHCGPTRIFETPHLNEDAGLIVPANPVIPMGTSDADCLTMFCAFESALAEFGYTERRKKVSHRDHSQEAMVGTPTLQLFVGLIFGSLIGGHLGWSYHPAFSLPGLVAGGVVGMSYAGLGCLACGDAGDRSTLAFQSRDYLRGVFWLLFQICLFAVFTLGTIFLLMVAS